MDYDITEYEDFSVAELTDEISGIDREIERAQIALKKLFKSIKMNEQLRSGLYDLIAEKSKSRGWPHRKG